METDAVPDLVADDDEEDVVEEFIDLPKKKEFSWDKEMLELAECTDKTDFVPNEDEEKPKGDGYKNKYDKWSYDFTGWGLTNYGTRKASEDARMRESVERTNGTLGWGPFYSVPLDAYIRFIENFIIQAYFYGKKIPLDESITKPFRLFFDFDLKNLPSFDKKMLYKLAYICSITIAEFYPEFNTSPRRLMPKSAKIDGESGDWTMTGDNKSFFRLCTLWSFGEPKLNRDTGKWDVGLHGNAIGNLYTNTEQARAIRRLIIARLINNFFGVYDFNKEYWAKAFDYGVLGSTDEEKLGRNVDLDSDKREGAMRLMGACKVAICPECNNKKTDKTEKNGCQNCKGRGKIISDKIYKPWLVLDGAGKIVNEKFDWMLEDPFQFVPACLIRTRVVDTSPEFVLVDSTPQVGFGEPLNAVARTKAALDFLKARFVEKFGIAPGEIEYDNDNCEYVIPCSAMQVCRINKINHHIQDEILRATGQDLSENGQEMPVINYLRVELNGQASWSCSLENRKVHPCIRMDKSKMRFLKSDEAKEFLDAPKKTKKKVESRGNHSNDSTVETLSIYSDEVKVMMDAIRQIRVSNMGTRFAGDTPYKHLDCKSATRRGKKYVVEVAGENDRFCYKAMRHHKSNHIQFYFYRSGIYPGCHDTDEECKRTIPAIPYKSHAVVNTLFPRSKFGPPLKEKRASQSVGCIASNPAGSSNVKEPFENNTNKQPHTLAIPGINVPRVTKPATKKTVFKYPDGKTFCHKSPIRKARSPEDIEMQIPTRQQRSFVAFLSKAVSEDCHENNPVESRKKDFKTAMRDDDERYSRKKSKKN